MVHTPLTFRQIYDSPLGRLTLSSNGQALTGLWMEGQQHFPADADTWPLTALPVFDITMAWLDQYFGGADPQVPLPPLLPAGTPFQQAVWHMLTEISRGTTVTYGQLAVRLGQLRHGTQPAARAVGHAVGRNPISILIPCHRVVGAGGQLTGYAGGLSRKRWLLTHEGVFKKTCRP